MIYDIHPRNPEGRKIKAAVEILKEGGLIVYPTDSVYGIGCDIDNSQAVERLCQIKQLSPSKANLSVLCRTISEVQEYTMPLQNSVFRIMKRNTPGPFTFILPTNHKVPKRFMNKKRTIGIRIPDNAILQMLLEEFGKPLFSTSLKKSGDDLVTYYLGVDEIVAEYKKRVEAIIDGGPVPNIPSAIIDCTGSEPEMIREGERELIL